MGQFSMEITRSPGSVLGGNQQVFISLGEFADVIQHPQGALSMTLRNADVALLALPPDLSRIYWREDVGTYVASEQAKLPPQNFRPLQRATPHNKR